MSQHGDEVKARHLRAVGCANAITALSAAGLAILQARGTDHDELVDAIRDDIKAMIGDVQALQVVVQGR